VPSAGIKSSFANRISFESVLVMLDDASLQSFGNRFPGRGREHFG
jgi:hypothetical protein